MTHEHLHDPQGDWPPKPRPMTMDEFTERYEAGDRHFRAVHMDGADFSALANVESVRFFMASLRGANFNGTKLTFTQFKAADLTGATFRESAVNAGDLIGANFQGADFSGADLTGATLNRSNLRNANLNDAYLGSASFSGVNLQDADLTGVTLTRTNLSDTDVSPFCDAARLKHAGPSIIDPWTVIRSQHHPRLKQFMSDCGVPPIFAEYMIECAAALSGDSLRSLLQSTFISYGGPDEEFARRLYNELRSYQVRVFFFPETARFGERIEAEVMHHLRGHDRVLLICSESSLTRPGVLHELRETLDREARDGGATYLLPVTIDDFVSDGWAAREPILAEQLKRRVVGDFRAAVSDPDAFNRAVRRLLEALRLEHPGRE